MHFAYTSAVAQIVDHELEGLWTSVDEDLVVEVCVLAREKDLQRATLRKSECRLPYRHLFDAANIEMDYIILVYQFLHLWPLDLPT